MASERVSANASITQMDRIVNVVCHSIMMLHGVGQHRKMYTNANVSLLLAVSSTVSSPLCLMRICNRACAHTQQIDWLSATRRLTFHLGRQSLFFFFFSMFARISLGCDSAMFAIDLIKCEFVVMEWRSISFSFLLNLRLIFFWFVCEFSNRNVVELYLHCNFVGFGNGTLLEFQIKWHRRIQSVDVA